MTRGLVVAAVLSLGAAGCGDGPRTAATPIVARPGCAGARPTDPVHRTSVKLARRSEISGARRPLDPLVWAQPGRCARPLILFSHGHYGDPAGCSRLCTALAARGFMVVAPHHADRGTPLSLQAAERDDDLAYALDHLPLRFDRRRVGVARHSFGGRTAVELAALDSRVKAVMTMAGGADRGTTSSIRVPTLMMAGGRDTVDPVRLSEASRDALPRSTPHGLLVVPRAAHGGLIDGCAEIGACSLVARTASAFFLTYLAGVRGADGPLKGIWSR